MIDWNPTSVEKLSEIVSGKTIASIIDEQEYDDFIVIAFTDGTVLRIRYDWVYEWEVTSL